MTPQELLRTVKTILVIDWPSRDVPESLASAGFQVIVKGGPGPQDYSSFGLHNGEIVVRRTGRAPESADLVYFHRPLHELPGIVDTAKSLGAKAIWTQSGLSAEGVKNPAGCWLPAADLESARTLVESAGLQYLASPYIVDISRQLG
ncbi:MAG TPA: CoA-binding protein [Bryobacteraceae bacterium]|nr:CoA-binding protein [Bryobacteraceae bacterium]